MSEAGFDHRRFLKTLSSSPGVYRMLDADGTVVYVGKARNLKNRVASYFRNTGLSPKTRALVAQIAAIEVTLTHTEGEALLLENHLIKQLKPRYNVLLRDDKSYPYIYVSTDQDHPRLAFHRGARKGLGRYFGPYPSAGAVRETLALLQKLFRVRQCEDSVYRNRTRPCLQYQIQRCTGPCVGLAPEAEYAEDVRHTLMFLEGRSGQVIDELGTRMEQAAEKLDFERAAMFRDQIARLRRVYDRQWVSGERGDLDILALQMEGGVACVQVFFVREGRNLGNRAYFPRIPDDAVEAEVMAAFIAQFYLERDPPGELLVNVAPADQELLAGVLAGQSGHKVDISARLRGERARWLDLALRNAREALAVRLASKGGMARRYQALQDAMGLPEPPTRMECFDISHTMGEGTVASCVVFDGEGPRKSDYRRFNIKVADAEAEADERQGNDPGGNDAGGRDLGGRDLGGHDPGSAERGITGGDDYAAMRQALTRRYQRIKRGEAPLPEILLIDGGKGQLRQAEEVLKELGIPIGEGGVRLLGVAKGPERKAGLEVLFLSASGTALVLPPDSPALHLIQQIRDEAHRFAITGHRQRRAKARTTSTLEAIPGLGPKRRQSLLKHFGGLREIQRAGIEDLAGAPGISRALAQRVYEHLHGESGA